MLMKKDFWLVINKLGLEDHEVDLAALIWEKCEKAMQGKTNQTPTLLTGKAPRIQGAKTFVLKPATPDETALTREELQFLKSHLNKILSFQTEYMKRLKASIANVWDVCDPSDPPSTFQFKSLNELKDIMRSCKSTFSKMSKIQTKIKRKLGK
jgi:hypothetical protein